MAQLALDIRFECTKKGRCCKDVIASDIAFSEVMNLRNELPFFPTLKVYSEDYVRQLVTPHPVTNNTLAKVIHKHFQYKDGWYFLLVWTVSKTGSDHCPALSEDNLCTVHTRRPAICAFYPMSIYFPPEWLPNVTPQLCQECGGFDGEPHIIKAGRLVDTSVHSRLNNARTALESDTRNLAKGELAHILFNEKNLAEAQMSNGIPLATVPSLAATLKYIRQDCNYFPDDGDLESFVDSQAKTVRKHMQRKAWGAQTLRNFFCHLVLDRLVKLGLDPFQEAYVSASDERRQANTSQFGKPAEELFKEFKTEYAEILAEVPDDAWMEPLWKM